MANSGEALFSRLERWFLKPMDLRPMAVCRVVFGLCVFSHYASLWTTWPAIFGPDGVFGHRYYTRFPEGAFAGRPGVHGLQILHNLDSNFAIGALYGLLLVCATLFAAGLFTRVTGVMTLILHSLFQAQNEFAYWGWGDMIRPFMLYTIIAPSNHLWSVDAWWRARRGRPYSREPIPAWSMRLLQVHVCMVYLVAGWARVDDPNWINGSMLFGTLSDPLFSRIRIDWYPLTPVLVYFCWAAWMIEMAAPILLWVKAYRKWFVLALWAFHGGLELLTLVGYWDYMMAAALTVFWWDRDGRQG